MLFTQLIHCKKGKSLLHCVYQDCLWINPPLLNSCEGNNFHLTHKFLLNEEGKSCLKNFENWSNIKLHGSWWDKNTSTLQVCLYLIVSRKYISSIQQQQKFLKISIWVYSYKNWIYCFFNLLQFHGLDPQRYILTVKWGPRRLWLLRYKPPLPQVGNRCGIKFWHCMKSGGISTVLTWGLVFTCLKYDAPQVLTIMCCAVPEPLKISSASADTDSVLDLTYIPSVR